MPTYEATDPNTGKKVTFDWYEDREPTEQEMESVFAQPEGVESQTALGGSGASMRAMSPEDDQSDWWGKARNLLFGDPERQEAEAAGIGLQPGAREMVTAPLGLAADAAAIAAPALGGPMVGTGLKAAGGAALRAAGMSGLQGGGAATGGLIGHKVGRASGIPYADTIGGVIGAGLGGMIGGRVGSAGTATKTAKAATAAKASSALASQSAVKAPGAIAAEAQKYEAQIVQLRTENGQSGAQIVNALKRDHGISPSKGQKMVDQVLETHGLKPQAGAVKIVPRADEAVTAQREFAKAAIPNGKFGEKIHVLLENGKPVEILTSGKAGAATRAGKDVTYLINTWGGN